MKITLVLPDDMSLNCAFLNYVFTDHNDFNMKMGCRSMGTDDLKDGAEVTVDPRS